jgi:hypothetical protein
MAHASALYYFRKMPGISLIIGRSVIGAAGRDRRRDGFLGIFA